MGKKPLDTSHPVVVAFLAISTQSKPVSDDQVVEIIKKKHPSLRDTTRDTLNALLGEKKSFILRDPVNGFIRKSYVVNKHSDPTLRCKCVVYGGVGRGGTKERDDDRQANAREEDWTGVCLRRRAESRRDSRS
jgi:hypothetical protein